MVLCDFYIIVQGLHLKKPIKIDYRVPSQEVGKWSIFRIYLEQLQSLSADSIIQVISNIDTVLHISENKNVIFTEKVKAYEEKMKQFEVGIEGLKKRYQEVYPLCLMVVKGIDIALSRFEREDIPKEFLEKIVDPFIYSMSFIHGCPAYPIAYILKRETEKRIPFLFYRVDLRRALPKERYEEYFQLKKIEEYVLKYTPKLSDTVRGGSNIGFALRRYRKALDTPEDEVAERVLDYWTILESLSEGKIKKVEEKPKEENPIFQKVRDFVSVKHSIIDEKRLKDYWKMRNALIHSGKPSKKYDYKTAQDEMREVIQNLVYKLLDERKQEHIFNEEPKKD